MLNTKHEEKVELNLEKSIDEASTASIKITTDAPHSITDWATTSTDIFVNADNDEQTVWINLRQHTYIQLGDTAPISVSNDIVSKHFSRAEAEALLAVLQHELGKLN